MKGLWLWETNRVNTQAMQTHAFYPMSMPYAVTQSKKEEETSLSRQSLCLNEMVGGGGGGREDVKDPRSFIFAVEQTHPSV